MSKIAIALNDADWPQARTPIVAALRYAGIRATAAVIAESMALSTRRHQIRGEREALARQCRKADRFGLARQVWTPGRIRALQAVLDARQDLRREARLAAIGERSGNPPVNVVCGCRSSSGRRVYHPIALGTGYNFRWRGKYKTYPGSYIPSDRRVAVPATWLALRVLREAEAGR